MKALTTLAAVGFAVTAHAQTTDSLRIYYVGRPVGWERYDVARRGDTTFFDADFSYIDRGRRVHAASTMALASDYTPHALSVYRYADTTRTVVAQVEFDEHVAAVTRAGRGRRSRSRPSRSRSPRIRHSRSISRSFAIGICTGSRDTIDVVPGTPTNRVAVRVSGKDTVAVDRKRQVLTRYTIDGVIWGREHVWVDAANRMAMFAAAGGGLSIKAINAALLPSAPMMMEIASRAAVNDLVRMTAAVKPVASGTIAFVGATLVDGSGAAQIDDAIVVVKNGRISAAGAASSTTIPKDAKRIDVHHKTIIPGLWDMHAHLHQAEWAPVYLATGVTTVRDMGNELPFVVGSSQSDIVGQSARAEHAARGFDRRRRAECVRRDERFHARRGPRHRAPLQVARLRADEVVLAALSGGRRRGLRRSARARDDRDGAHSDVAVSARRGRFGNGSDRASLDSR